MPRDANILKVTRRLILMTGAVLLCVVLVFGVTLVFGKHFMVSWVCFGCGLLGGFISLQQRLKRVRDAELELLSRSWFQIALVPIYGGLFALILYVAFLSQIVTGALFPQFYVPAFDWPPNTANAQAFFRDTFPASGADLAKLLFWSLIAGFSERMVPQIIGKSGSDAGGAHDRG